MREQSHSEIRAALDAVFNAPDTVTRQEIREQFNGACTATNVLALLRDRDALAEQAALTESRHGSREWFLQQQSEARKEMESWPKFMKDGNVVATAALPTHPQGAADRSAEALKEALALADSEGSRAVKYLRVIRKVRAVVDEWPEVEMPDSPLSRIRAIVAFAGAAMGTPAAAEPGKGEGK